MALFLPTLGEIRGSIAGNTFSKNAQGQYIRQRVSPVQPGTPAQSVAKGLLTNASVRWKSLTEAQREAWSLYAQNTPVVNKLGQSVNISGLAWYIAINSFFFRATATYRDDAPTLFGRAEQIGVGFDNQDTFELVSFADPGGNAQLVIAHWAGPFPQSINFFKGPFPAANVLLGDPASFTNVSLVDPATPGSRFFFQWRTIDDFFRTTPLNNTTIDIVVTPP